MKLQLLEALLHPLPVCHLLLLGPAGDLRVFLCVPLKHAGADEKHCVGDCVYQRLGIVEDEPPSDNPVAQPCDEVLAGWLAKGRPLV